MTYEEAMEAIRDVRLTVVRASGPSTLRVARRFGRAVVLAADGRRHIDYTPTIEEYRADDWQVSDQAAGSTETSSSGGDLS